MKRLLAFLLLLSFAVTSFAQYPGNANDWVEYDKTYYRFSINEDGIYRLMKSDLVAAGLSETDLIGEHFKMVRNGEEIPLYVSTNGSFSDSDFIEFLGKKNDGTTDTPLYNYPSSQPGTSKSLFSDYSIHFLTIDNGGNHLRLNSIENELTDLPEKEEYFMAEVVENSGSYGGGRHTRFGGINLFESDFNESEGFNYRLNANSARLFDFLAGDVYTGATQEATVEFRVASLINNNNFQPGEIEISLGSSSRENHDIPGTFSYTVFQKNYPATEVGNSKLRIRNFSPARIYISERKLTYPRGFDFTDKSFQYVKMNKSGALYLEFENLPSTNNKAILYDLSANNRLEQTIESITAFKTSENSTTNYLVFDTDIAAPNFVGTIDFENVVQAQHDLLVIYHKAFEEPVNGENYLQKFIDHKTSAIGGNLDVLKIDIDQIIDQFAYGVKTHPAGIKNLIAQLKEDGNLPKNVLLIGKGYEYNVLYSNEFENNYIPSYGNPASDSQMVADYGNSDLNCGIGRIAARSPQELQYYVDKVIEYQTLMGQTDDVYQTKDKLWMKNGMHLGGGANASEQNTFRGLLNQFKGVFESPEYGGKVYSYFKTTTDPIQTADVASIDSLISSGVSLINYFGHSAINTLEFDISNFSSYDHEGKYPFMLTNGCYVGDLFQERLSLGEEFVLTDNAGTLSFMGPSQFGIASGMSQFCRNFYDLFIEDEYGMSIGEAIMLSQNMESSGLIERLTKQQMILHGDPTLSIYAHEKPDYLVTEEDVIFEPAVITTDVEEFTANIVVSNIGKALDEPVKVTITRFLPNGEEESQTLSFDNVYYQEKISFTFQTNALQAEGINQFMVEIDREDELDEITRANNNLGSPINLPIINDAVKPILPAEFAITNNSNLELISYTSRFTSSLQNFEVQIDTTELFNSSFLLSGNVSSNGGTIKWKPEISYENERVYYWRVRKQGDDNEWFNSSFVFLDEYEEGWNQSHYFQFLKDDYNKFYLDDSRLFEFGVNNRTVNVRTSIYPTIPRNQIAYSLDGVLQARRRCNRNEERLGIAIFDENTGIPLENQDLGGGEGFYNSIYCSRDKKLLFYQIHTPEARAKVIDALNSIPDNKYVLLYSLDAFNPVEFDWASENDLRPVLQANGAQNAFNIVDNASYAFFFQKGNPDFEGTADFYSTDNTQIIDEDLNMPVKFPLGDVTTTMIGPAANWNTLLWSWDNSYDNIPEGDMISYSIIGVTADETETLITSGLTDQSYDLSAISAETYPYLKIKVDFEDRINFSPAQLQYIRVLYETLPEMAIDVTSIVQAGQLSFDQHQPANLTYSLDNIYTKDMSPILVSYTYTQAAGGQSNEEIRYEALPAGESQSISYELNTSPNAMVGNSLLYIDANPNTDQPEQYHFNNIALIEFDVKKDNENPYLDVTFDGIHIIDGDLVSDTPEIIISLTDENEYLLLNNPDDFEVIVTFPNGERVTYTAASPEITFYPASDLNDNSAKIEFSPEFAPGVYSMQVQAKDRSNNQAGRNDYIISFEVTNEDIITQVINYPNPFTTSTEFIARIIGDAPDEVLIQIFSPSGQVIRELHSYSGDISLSQGNNYYTVAKWDGTDEFGDPIGNGVYFYKISMKRNGELIEAYDSDTYSEYFHNGIGKLYILR